MFDRRLIQNFDWTLLVMLLFLIGISILNMYSATYATSDAGGGAQVFSKQVYWFAIGFGVMLFMTTFNYSILERLAYPLYFSSLFLLVLVLFAGPVISGSQRWLFIGPVSFQPAELTKVALVIVLAKYFSNKPGHQAYRLKDIWQPLMLTAVPALLIIKEPDLGTALLLVIVAFSVVLFARVNMKSLLALIISAVLLSPFIWFGLEPYQQDRIRTLFRPDMDPLGAGYHINQSKIAIGSGMLYGKGFLEGTQTRLHFLPEQHTDFVFSVLAEEWGFIGSLVVLMLYLFLILRGLNIAKNSKDRFGTFIAIGLLAIIFWQVVVNVGMVTGLLPVVGIPLVFMSYGGSSLVTTMAIMGLLINISMRRFMFH